MMNTCVYMFICKINIYTYAYIGTSLVAQSVKNLPVMQEAWVQFQGQEDPPEKEMATHSQYSWLENPHAQRSLGGYSPRGHKSQTRLSD